MIQAANDLRKAYPQAYALLAQSADAVSTILIKQRKFDQAIALYQPLVGRPQARRRRRRPNQNRRHLARGRQGSRLLPVDAPRDAGRGGKAPGLRRAGLPRRAEEFPRPARCCGRRLRGTGPPSPNNAAPGVCLRTPIWKAIWASSGPIFPPPDMQARFELAKAGLVFLIKDGAKQYPAALDRFKKVINDNPGLALTRQETDQFRRIAPRGEGLSDRLENLRRLTGQCGAHRSSRAGRCLLRSRRHLARAGRSGPGPGLLHQTESLAWRRPVASPTSSTPILASRWRTNNRASQPTWMPPGKTYAQLMQAPQGGFVLQAKAMLGYGRLLEKAGYAVKPSPQGPNEYAVHYYQEPNLLYGPAVPALSAEGLFDAGQAYEKAGRQGPCENPVRRFAQGLRHSRSRLGGQGAGRRSPTRAVISHELRHPSQPRRQAAP